MSARVYLMKTVNGCKDGSTMSFQVKRTSLLCFYTVIFLLLSTTVCSQDINNQIVNIADENLTDYSFLSRYHYTKLKKYLKDDIEFVIEFPCVLGPCTKMLVTTY